MPVTTAFLPPPDSLLSKYRIDVTGIAKRNRSGSVLSVAMRFLRPPAEALDDANCRPKFPIPSG
jgi:hypothetical protein